MVLCYTNYCLIHITFYFTLHISFYNYIFIWFYTYIFICFYRSILIFPSIILFSTVKKLYGFLTVPSTIFSTVFFCYSLLLLRFTPYGRLYSLLARTVTSTSFYTVFSTVVSSVRFSLLLFSTYSIIFSSYSL